MPERGHPCPHECEARTSVPTLESNSLGVKNCFNVSDVSNVVTPSLPERTRLACNECKARTSFRTACSLQASGLRSDARIFTFHRSLLVVHCRGRPHIHPARVLLRPGHSKLVEFACCPGFFRVLPLEPKNQTVESVKKCLGAPDGKISYRITTHQLMTPLVRKADWYFVVTLTSDSASIADVPCYVFLPRKVADDIELHFLPTVEQYKVFINGKFLVFSIYGEECDDHGLRMTISANQVIVEEAQPVARFDPQQQISTTALDLRITHVFGNGSQKLHYSFKLTPNVALSNFLRPKKKKVRKLGDDKVTRWFSELKIKNLGKVLFFNDRKSYINSNRERVEFTELSARIELSKARRNVPTIDVLLSTVDDLMLLSSFAARNLTMCLAWESFDGFTTEQQFLRDRAVPNSDELTKNGLSPVIDLSDFGSFLPHAYESMRNYSDTDALRQALFGVVLVDRTSIEMGFIQLFTVLEMIVLHFRRKTNAEFIFPPELFEKVRPRFARAIGNTELKIEGFDEAMLQQNKGLMQKNVGALNRISLATAFRRFRESEDYELHLRDLWPVPGGHGSRSLLDIRNRLAHGERFERSQFYALLCARQHLRWTVERMLLKLFKWPLEDSHISPAAIKDDVNWQWKAQRKLL